MDYLYLLFLGVLDGLNICNLSLLALFISLSYSLGAERSTILILGTLYILGVFSSYMLLGLGMLTISLSIPTLSHLLTRVSTSLMIIIGAVNILSYFGVEILPLNRSSIISEKAITYMWKLGYVSSFVAGFLAGFHNLPCACTGGVYPAFISIIAGAPYSMLLLAIYNILFILPLAAILYIASSKKVIVGIRRWHQENKQKLKLLLGVTITFIGLLFLLLIFIGAP